MLNKKPIFIVGFTRGGSNILLNLLRSHPDVCSPRGELQQVFRGKVKTEETAVIRWMKKLRYAPILLREGRDIFSKSDWTPREPISNFSKRRIDQIMYAEKLRARGPTQNKYKTEDVEYTRDEVAQARLLNKNLNGTIFTIDIFAEMYPDATFIGLIRNGFAVIEGNARRHGNLVEFAEKYHIGCQQMIHYSNTLDNFHIIQFEDLVNKPSETLDHVFHIANLDGDKLKKIRLGTKPTIDATGQPRYMHGKDQTQLVWYDRDQFHNHFDTNVNDNQIQKLTDSQQQQIISICGESLSHFGYI